MSNELYWHNCYKGTYDLIAPDSVAHPAKMSPALCFRILEHLQELGLLKEGDTILDPMAGTGMTNICAGAMGYPSVSVELEEKFVDFEKQNKEYAERRLHKSFDWQIIQGDSRRLSGLLKDEGLVSVTSPPYGDAGAKNRGDTNKELSNGIFQGRSYRPGDAYSNNPANLGNLPDKPLKSVMSPPYENALESGSRHTKGGIPARDSQLGALGRYGEMSEGQIGQEKAESYLEAMLQVYQEIAKVSDVLVVVVKCPTRAGKLRRLDTDTIKILELSGWTIHCQHRALLFEELGTATLFGEPIKKVKGRLSFFKRLSWQNGNPVANFEDIIIAVNKPS